ncbi:hypothetical protein CK203_078356 [Vitis vinifera]|uniref:Uncharacterized protein n=3 Tax=Vitis vinifera TaxID=29760 RepID=A0A438DXK0_VITVI|nr:hypothetical protein CK203_078356 [Vitis vinifera]
MENITASELAGFGVGTLLLCATIAAPRVDSFISASQRRSLGMCKKCGDLEMIACSKCKGVGSVKAGAPFSFNLVDDLYQSFWGDESKYLLFTMYQRLQSFSRSSSGRVEGFNRYLKPGQLAQLRDSKINARSHKLTSRTGVNSVTSTHSESAQIQILMNEHLPCFTKIIEGPHCLRRKKLVASKSVFLLNLNPSTPISGPIDSLMNVLGTDLLVAH